MKGPRDSTGLFIQQVERHAQLLSDLLETNCDAPIESGHLEKCILSTKMLKNSVSLLGLGLWEELLNGYESLMLDYREQGCNWDEKIAQITSELIEKEEQLAERSGDGEWNPDGCITQEEVRALNEEINILLSMDRPVAVAAPAMADEGPGELKDDAEEDARAEGSAEEQHSAGEPESGPDYSMRQEFIGGLMAQLEKSTGRLFQEWKRWKSGSDECASFDIQLIKQDSYLIHFYALSLVEIAEMRNEPVNEPVMSTLEHLRVVLDLYAELLSERDGCRVDIGFLGEDNTLDVAMLFNAAKILKCMISDISQRSSESYLRIEIEVENRNGALWWSLRDNGDNFITDSRLDRDDFLAFYPGLREVKRQLEQFNGVLWVEPDEDHDRRFAFTTPLHANTQSFTVWQHEGARFCIPSLQVCEIIPGDEADIYRDGRGEYVLVDDAQVPLLGLSLLCPEAPERGGTIVVAGSLEKRIAFYVRDQGTIEEGPWRKASVPSWNGLSWGVAELAGEHVPVIECARIVRQYLSTLGTASGQRMTGSIIENEQEYEADASSGSPAKDDPHSVDEVDVVVFEKSEAVRDALAAILTPMNLSVRMYEEPGRLEDVLQSHDPAIIISDSRDASGGAKMIVDWVRAAGKQIPVLLSTAQNEDTASALVSEIGASGYFLKPLDNKKVRQVIRRFVPVDENCVAQE